MQRTTIVADDAVIGELRQIARREGVSLATVIRQALEARTRQSRPAPRSFGAFRGGPGSTGHDPGDGAFEPPSWRS